MRGFFHLKTPKDLFSKLGRELARLRDEPNNVDHAFNFFVTAEHMIEWAHPDMSEAGRRAFRAANPYLFAAFSLATGAKHFQPHEKNAAGVRSAKAVYRLGPQRYANRQITAYTPPRPSLIVELPPEAASMQGSDTASALDLAERVYQIWTEKMKD